MQNFLIASLRAVVTVIMLGLLGAQVVVFPLAADEAARTFPEVAWLRWPLLSVVIVGLALAQVALGCLEALLTMIQRDTIFTPRALRPLTAIIALIVADTVAVTGINVYLSVGLQANPPGIFLGLAALTVTGVAAALLVGVLRGLVRRAIGLRTQVAQLTGGALR